MSNNRDGFSRMELEPQVVVVAVLCGVFGLVFLPQVLAVSLTSPGWLRGHGFWQVLGLWFTFDPGRVTGGNSLTHLGLVYGLLLLLVSGVVLVLRMVSARAKDPQQRPGLADHKSIREELSEKQLLKRAARLRPGLAAGEVKAEAAGFLIGSFKFDNLWLRFEDPTIVIGPSRSGKGWFLALNWLMAAPGAVITTSSKMDNAHLTYRAREEAGSRGWVFAPGVAGGDDFGRQLRWDPVAGCTDEATLVRRIKALIPSGSFGSSTSNGGHWDTLGQQLAAHLFHAAACGGFGVNKIWEWVGSPQRASAAVRLIREHSEGLIEHANHLETVLNMPADQRGTSWGVLPTVLAFLESRSARAWLTPVEGEEGFDPIRFFLESETLYLVGDKNTSGGYVRVIDGVLSELDYVSKGLADASCGGRLDPPVTYLLDEAGNFEYQGMYELITAGGGRGRVGIVILQSKSQLSQFGEGNADTLWDAAVCKIVLPGGANARELQDLAALIGKDWTVRQSKSVSAGQGASFQYSSEKRDLFEANEIRELKSGYAIMFYRHLKPIIVKLNPFSDNPRYEVCERYGREAAELVRARSPFAAAIENRGLDERS